MQITNYRRVAMLCSVSLLLALPLGINAQAQPAPEILIDRMLRSDSQSTSSSDRNQALLASFKVWMGTYQRLISKDDNKFMAVFDRGSLPIEIRPKSSGSSIDNLSFGCPITRSLSLSTAPSNLQKALSKCAGFKS
ncbi:hypothetical protein [Chamaesiphon sp. VAR_48_metabat_403]|uniref:hypothetical protein n=1 Tax=Chamaesiphon sp. VAR_48_metabat_403 TaxID=2964700 RepID=UPI00286E073D|nr:hypothetical protein [Chamaesiphon sp. VAR_48_metabat_403]